MRVMESVGSRYFSQPEQPVSHAAALAELADLLDACMTVATE
jgi:hypothetical protein